MGVLFAVTVHIVIIICLIYFGIDAIRINSLYKYITSKETEITRVRKDQWPN